MSRACVQALDEPGRRRDRHGSVGQGHARRHRRRAIAPVPTSRLCADPHRSRPNSGGRPSSSPAQFRSIAGGCANALLVNEVPAVPDHEPSHVFDERQCHPEHLRPAWLNLAIRRLRQGPAEQKTAAVIAQLDRVGRAPSQRPPRPGRIMDDRNSGYAVIAIDAQAQEQGFRLPRWSSGNVHPGGSDGKPPSLRRCTG